MHNNYNTTACEEIKKQTRKTAQDTSYNLKWDLIGKTIDCK